MQGTAATIGFFDGVHKGHQFLLRQLVREAEKQALTPIAISFSHESECLTPNCEKEQRIKQLGIKELHNLPFTDSLKEMSAFSFMKEVLCDRFNTKLLLVGCDNRFGHNRQDGFAEYLNFGQQLGMTVLQGEEIQIDGEKISSSQIRRLLQNGRVKEANYLLGYNYRIIGNVVHGNEIGRKLGYPTANIQPLTKDKLIPKEGVYCVYCNIPGENKKIPGIMNIGSNPTISDRGKVSIEIHIMDFEGNLYGKEIEIEILMFIRSEQKFQSLDELQKQINKDIFTAKNFFNL